MPLLQEHALLCGCRLRIFDDNYGMLHAALTVCALHSRETVLQRGHRKTSLLRSILHILSGQEESNALTSEVRQTALPPWTPAE